MTDPMPPAAGEDAPTHAGAERVRPVGTPVSARRRVGAAVRAMLPSFNQGVVGLLALNMIFTGGVLVRQLQGTKPVIATVGVRQLTNDHVAKMATARNMTPEEARIRTELFLSVAQDSMKRMSTQKGVVVLARECVLAGEYADVTFDVAKSVNAVLSQASGGLAATAPLGPPAMPTPGRADG